MVYGEPKSGPDPFRQKKKIRVPKCCSGITDFHLNIDKEFSRIQYMWRLYFELIHKNGLYSNIGNLQRPSSYMTSFVFLYEFRERFTIWWEVFIKWSYTIHFVTYFSVKIVKYIIEFCINGLTFRVLSEWHYNNIKKKRMFSPIRKNYKKPINGKKTTL